MKILFVENRYKTYFYDEVARHLIKEHEVFWIVQNKTFKPKNGTIFKLNNRKSKNIKEVSIDLKKIISSDRIVNYFKKQNHSYFANYASKIETIIDAIKPNVVFGESTLFHELITIELCKQKEILFLHPSSSRYPSNRFSFYLYDTVFPYKGSQEVLDNETALGIINKICDRSSKPDYMKPTPFSKGKLLADKFKILKGYYFGEKYNTPNPVIKYKAEKNKSRVINSWDSNAATQMQSNAFKIVYPLHMQPEANIDVWGRSFRDQLKTIKSIASQLTDNQVLYVKPNPKSKYELTEPLIKFAIEHKNVQILHHSISMDAIFKSVDLFITVNGTIALECIFANKPVLTLINGFFNKASNCLYLNDYDQLQTYLEKAKTKTFPQLSEQKRIDFLNLLNSTSYSGIISDPFYNPSCILKENIDAVTSAFKAVLTKNES